jgi:hypothetical protein
METAESLREKAAHCRQLADAIFTKSDPTRIKLLEMAVEFERSAAAMEEKEA